MDLRHGASPRESAQEFCFELLAGGRNTAEVFEGDTLELTVTLRLPEQQQTAQLYALQNELDFDASMLELVAGSVKAAPGFDAGVSLLGGRGVLAHDCQPHGNRTAGDNGCRRLCLVSFQVRAVGQGETVITGANAKIHDASGALLPVTANSLSVSVKQQPSQEDGGEGGGAGGGGGGGGGAGGGGGGGAGPQDPHRRSRGKLTKRILRRRPRRPPLTMWRKTPGITGQCPGVRGRAS